jgi:hypothetical protein
MTSIAYRYVNDVDAMEVGDQGPHRTQENIDQLTTSAAYQLIVALSAIVSSDWSIELKTPEKLDQVDPARDVLMMPEV